MVAIAFGYILPVLQLGMRQQYQMVHYLVMYGFLCVFPFFLVKRGRLAR